MRVEQTGYGGDILFRSTGEPALPRRNPLGASSSLSIPQPDQKVITAPWPFVQYASGELNRRTLWPLWGKKEQGDSKSGFFLWPLVHWYQLEENDTTERSVQVLPFYKSTRRAQAVDGQMHRWQLWPLIRGRSHAAHRSWEVLSLWPFPKSDVIERNWAATWRLFEYERQVEDVEWSLLHGLVSFKREGSQKSGRLFYLLNWRWGERSSGD